MMRVYQTAHGPRKGDCWRACIASLLELLPQQVPDFVNNSNRHWLTNTKRWLRNRGKRLIHLCDHRKPYIQIVQAEKSLHALIMYHGKVLHDPSGSTRPVRKRDLLKYQYQIAEAA
jgi:hypothetical protein